jgi:RNA polymerase sigma-70 factor, ECF subfamily
LAIDNTILQQFVKGDKKAFDQVYNAFAGAMYGICLRYARCDDDAQDMLQEGFIRVYKSANTFSLGHPFPAWMKTIFINTSISYIRKNYRFDLKEDDAFFDQQVHEAETGETNAAEMKQRLLKILNQLPDGYRTVFNLFVIDNLTHKEIAEYLEISESTSKTQYLKAKRMIQQLLMNEQVRA